jgi:hypothetical protein
MGCGAFLAVKPPGWSLPEDWAPGADDTRFAVDVAPGSDSPARVTGVGQPGRERIEPGDYRLVVIETRSPDTLPPTLSALVGCSVEVSIPPGTRAVSVEVKWDHSSCMIAVSKDVPLRSGSTTKPARLEAA